MEWKVYCMILDLSSCAGRCGEGYSRDATCNCDYNCQHYMECCPDFKKVCTVELSCKGRCFESFARGRECDCDAQCKKFGKCCADYESFCEEVKDNKKDTPKKESAPKPPVVDDTGSGLDSGETKLTPTPDIPTTPHNKTNLCNGKPVDGLTTLRNGTLVAFRGHYFWMLNPYRPPSPPRRITEVWGIPSPIDTVFTRCNCEGKTFFFKDSQYWRFTNDIQDAGYPKQIVKGFGGLTGKIVAALSIAKFNNRPESVYFFKRGGNIQQYTYKQEPTTKCSRRRPAINYSVYGEAAQVRRRRFERAVGPSQTHTFRIHYSPIRVAYQDKGFLHNEVKVSTMWRGFPNVVTSAITLPNSRKPDGYDYYAFSKDQYYNIDVPSRTARPITTRSGQTLSKVWYNCP
uniref:Proteoglycan 4 (megakaryocyte stimulating factor, articular superficial zone protein) n=1 Tax=Nannospalax galili TaxID=1026970 RepID=A0A8C6R8R8_NANGA